jgi:hypothetical protein
MAHTSLRIPTLALRDLRFLLIASAIAFRAILGVTDPDLWWHLKTGELIVKGHHVLTSDPFSWTTSGREWILHEWLSEVIIYLLKSSAGYELAVAACMATIVATFLIVYRLGLRICSRELAVAGVVALSATMMLNFTLVRPQMFTWLFFAIFVRQLYLHFRDKSASLWLLPLLMVLWSNMHLGYLFGLAAVWIWVLSIILRDRVVGRSLAMPILLAVSCSLAPAISPDGPRALLFPLDYLASSRGAFAAIQEWGSPDFHNPSFWGFPIAVAVLLIIGLPRGRQHTFGTFMLLIFFVLALISVRNIPLFAIIFPVVAAESLARRDSQSAIMPTPKRVERNALNWALLVSVVALVFTVALLATDAQVHSEPNVSSDLPSSGVTYIRQHKLGTRILNPYDWGGYLIAQLYPDVKVSIDGRADLYGDQLLDQYSRLVTLQPGWREQLAALDPDFILLPKDSAFAGELRLSTAWTEAFEGPVEAIFVPAGSSATVGQPQ